MAGLFTSASTYVEFADNAALDLPSTGWLMQFFVYPTAVAGSAHQYIYSHGQPLTSVPAMNLYRQSSGNTLRLILDWAGGNLVSYATTTALLTPDTWNTVVVAYDTVNLFIGVGTNGTSNTETISPPALPTTSPAGVARLGQASWVLGTSRWWDGRIAQAFKSNITVSLAEVARLAASFTSPGFFPATAAWSVPMWNSPSFDITGALTVTDAAMSFGADGPWILPTARQNLQVFVTTTPSPKITQYFRIG